jgi:hypothetical protein
VGKNTQKDLLVKVLEKRPPGAIIFHPSPTPYSVYISYTQYPTPTTHDHSLTVSTSQLFRIKTVFEGQKIIFKHDYVYIMISSEFDINAAITCSFRKLLNIKRSESM